MLQYTETKSGTRWYNLTAKSLGEVISEFPRDLMAEKVVVLPDLSPSSRALLPNGSCVVIDQNKDPRWRRFAVSDVGCGMALVRSKVQFDDFDRNLDAWDEMARRLRQNKGKKGDLGRGNHFLDAVVDSAGNETSVYFAIHTGSRDESPKANHLVNNPSKFDTTYKEIKDWARGNRHEITHMLEAFYGQTEIVFDRPHNFYIQRDNRAFIYKGSVKLSPGEETVIPSNLDGEMAIVQANNKIFEIEGAMSHGTGRLMRRALAKVLSYTYDFDGLKKRIIISEGISNASLRGELPYGYRKLDDCLSLLDEVAQTTKRLTTVAYIGQI